MKQNKEQTAEEYLKDMNNVEKLSAILHEIYQLELLKQGKISKYSDNYEDLSEDIKNLDRALARFIIRLLSLKEQECYKKYWSSDEALVKAKQQGKQDAIKDEIEFLEEIKQECNKGEYGDSIDEINKRLQSLKEKIK